MRLNMFAMTGVIFAWHILAILLLLLVEGNKVLGEVLDLKDPTAFYNQITAFSLLVVISIKLYRMYTKEKESHKETREDYTKSLEANNKKLEALIDKQTSMLNAALSVLLNAKN